MIAKLTALINGDCYRKKDGTNLYCDEKGEPKLKYEKGKLSLEDKIYLISQISTALGDFFEEVLLTKEVTK